MTATLASGKVLTNTYDAIGRVTQRRLGLVSNYDTVLTYKPGANSSQTALLATYQSGDDTIYAYAHDMGSLLLIPAIELEILVLLTNHSNL